MSEHILERERAFLAQDTIYPEADGAVHYRWEAINATWEPVRGKRLWDTLDAELHEAWQLGNGTTVSAALDFILLRYRFFEDLYERRIGRRHVNIWHLEATAAWRNRLLDRLNQLEPVARKTNAAGVTKIVYPVVPPALTPKWLH